MLPKGACLKGLNKVNNVMVLEGIVILEEVRSFWLKFDFSTYHLLFTKKCEKDAWISVMRKQCAKANCSDVQNYMISLTDFHSTIPESCHFLLTRLRTLFSQKHRIILVGKDL